MNLVNKLSLPKLLIDLAIFFNTSPILDLNLLNVSNKSLNLLFTDLVELNDLKNSLIFLIALGKILGTSLILATTSLTSITNGFDDGAPTFDDIRVIKSLITSCAFVNAYTNPLPIANMIAVIPFINTLSTLEMDSNKTLKFNSLEINSAIIPNTFNPIASALPTQPNNETPSRLIPVRPLIRFLIIVPIALKIWNNPSKAIRIYPAVSADGFNLPINLAKLFVMLFTDDIMLSPNTELNASLIGNAILNITSTKFSNAFDKLVTHSKFLSFNLKCLRNTLITLPIVLVSLLKYSYNPLFSNSDLTFLIVSFNSLKGLIIISRIDFANG